MGIGVIVGVVDRIGDGNARRVFHRLVHERTRQPTEDKALIVEVVHLRPIQRLMMLHLGQRRFQGVGQVQHAKTAIAEARARRIDVGERRGRVRATGNAERDLAAGDQFKMP
ncbi:hypothetical protein D3C86_1255840 [compost metagenome]